MFLFSCHCVSLSAVIVNKKIRGAALGCAVGVFFAFIFPTQHPYLHYSKRDLKYFNVTLFRIASKSRILKRVLSKNYLFNFYSLIFPLFHYIENVHGTFFWQIQKLCLHHPSNTMIFPIFLIK